MERQAAVTIKDLSFSYDAIQILNDITASIPQGSFTAVLGPNGSGKTTLLKQILGILQPDAGEIRIGGQEISRITRDALARLIGMVPQQESIGYQFTVEQMVALGRYAHKDPSSTATGKIVEQVMCQTNIRHVKDHLITEISGGEYQRVLIARALAQQPRILVLDEPTTYLDPRHQIEILQLIRSLISGQGLTIICVLHDLNSAMQYSDHVIMLKEGSVFGCGTPEQMLTQEHLKLVYDIDTNLVKSPFTGLPVIIPDPRG